MQPLLEISDLWVKVEGKEVLKGVSLKIFPGEVHAIMGRNGSGKTSLSYTLMGHPKYQIERGSIRFLGQEIQSMSPDERARLGLFLAFQYPVAIPGLTVANFLRASARAVLGDSLPPKQLRQKIRELLTQLQIPEGFMNRSLNDGFSGGEKKKLETLQLCLLKPALAILDETDSGLDIDALRLVAEQIDQYMKNTDHKHPRALLLITHYQRMLNYIKPDYVHVFMDGCIARSGDYSLAIELESKGYNWVNEELPVP